MSKWHKTASLASLAEGMIHSVAIADTEIAIVVHRGMAAAYLDRCPHQPIRLSDFGCLFQGEIMCEAHGARFDAQSGALLKGPALSGLTALPVKIDGGMIYVDEEALP